MKKKFSEKENKTPKLLGVKNRGERREEVFFISNAKVNLTNNFSPYYKKDQGKIAIIFQENL